MQFDPLAHLVAQLFPEIVGVRVCSVTYEVPKFPSTKLRFLSLEFSPKSWPAASKSIAALTQLSSLTVRSDTYCRQLTHVVVG